MTDEIVEIPKSRLDLLERVGALANDLWNDEKVGMTLKERVKEKNPSANIPEVVVAQSTRRAEQELLARVEAKEKAVEDRIAAFEKAQKERDEKDVEATASRVFESEVEAGKKKYHLTSEGVEKVFARMKEKNNPDFEAAAAWVTDHEVKATPITSSNYSPQNMDLYGSGSGDEEWASLNKDPLKYGDRVLAEMASDFANGNFGRYKEFGGTV